MQFSKLALALTLSVLCFGCQIRISKARSQNSQTPKPLPMLNTSLKAAIEEVRVMKVKIERDGGVNPKEYSEDITDVLQIIDNAYGDAKTLKDVKSIVEGHELALQLLQCDRISGYDELHQCQDKVLKQLMVKYPDFAAEVKAVVEGENLPYMSAGLDKEAVLHSIWREIGEDTDTVLIAISPESSLKVNLSQK